MRSLESERAVAGTKGEEAFVGAWGELAFDNDTANDWAYDLEDLHDLSLVESAFGELEDAGADYLDADAACNALAACEVLARLKGNHGYRNAYTEKVDEWAAAHASLPIPPALVQRGVAAIERILGDRSELRELWDEGDGTSWRATVDDLRRRLVG